MGHGFHGYVNLVNSQRPVQTGSPDIGNFVATKEFLLLGDGPPDAATKKNLCSRIQNLYNPLQYRLIIQHGQFKHLDKWRF